MKKYITILILIGLLSTSLPIHAQEGKRYNEKSEFVKDQVKKQKKKKVIVEKQSTDISSETQTSEQRKKDIEANERSVNKNKKVRRCGFDKHISQIIKKRNIP